MNAIRQARKPVNRRAAEANARLDRVLLAARKEFLQKGYRLTSLDSILEKSGGSKATLLKYFGNKAGLFAAVISTVVKDFVHSLDGEQLQASPDEALQWFGEEVLKFYLRSDSLAIYRGVMAEGHLNPGMARAFYEGGYSRIVDLLAQCLTRWHNGGQVSCPDPHGDAERFLQALRGGLYERTLLGLTRNFSRRDISTQIEGTVKIFLHGLTRHT